MTVQPPPAQPPQRPHPPQLEYARQPTGSIASCQYRADGGVIIVIPPVVHRTAGKVILAVSGVCLVTGAVLFLAIVFGPLWRYPEFIVVAGVLALPAIGGLCVTLWMGFRWTIIEAGPEGLRLELRGLLATRRWFIPRERIGRLRKRVSIRVLVPRGRSLGRIDATNQAEDAWVMEILTRVLAIPPPLPSAPTPPAASASPPPPPPPPLQKTA